MCRRTIAYIRIQVSAIRQIFEQHILDLRLEKSRNAQNQKPMFSYNWDIDVGVACFIPNTEDLPTVSTPIVKPWSVLKRNAYRSIYNDSCRLLLIVYCSKHEVRL